MGTRVGINGFGRIGRNAFKAALMKGSGLDVVAINDVTDPKTLAHLLKYDSCFGAFAGDVEAGEGSIAVDGREIRVTAIRSPQDIPWADLGADIVIESTGLFTGREEVSGHLQAGAGKVVVTAPAAGADKTIVMGVNEGEYDPEAHHIVSNASCTTNCLAPIAKVVDREWGIARGMMTTVHSYTNDQRILDLPHGDLRRARAAALSIIPTSTGAAKAVSLVLPQLEGRLNGIAMRVPTPAVSVVDAVLELERPACAEDVNAALREAAEREMPAILAYCEEPLVSVDFKGDTHSSIVDALSTMAVGGSLLKVVAWYDNEWGYSNRVVDLVEHIAAKGI